MEKKNLKKLVSQNFVMFNFSKIFAKIGSVACADQQIHLVSPYGSQASLGE